MAKPRPGRCVHCLASVDAITDDHLFPRSWYPSSTPENLEKWKFPACSKCNREYGRLEEDLRLLLSACVSTTGAASAGIWEKARDSMNPDKARDAFDAMKRRMARNRFLKRLRELDPSFHEHALPEIHPDRPKGTIALLVPAKELTRFIEKLVKGAVYLTERRYIEQSQKVTVSILKPEDSAPILNLLDQVGEMYERGLGIRIRKGTAQEARTNAIFVFDIWDQFRFHGAVTDLDL